MRTDLIRLPDGTLVKLAQHPPSLRKVPQEVIYQPYEDEYVRDVTPYHPQIPTPQRRSRAVKETNIANLLMGGGFVGFLMTAIHPLCCLAIWAATIWLAFNLRGQRR